MKNSGRQCFWKGIEWYHNLKQQLTDEMTKDGYHIDSVFLQENQKMYDFLRVFRDLIREGKLQKGMTLDEFIQQCCRPDSNFKDYDKEKYYTLHVNYTFDYKQYCVVYRSLVKFPIYSEKTIRDNFLDTGVTLAEVVRSPQARSGIDITQTAKKIAGPLGNFYSDMDWIQIKMSDIDSRMPEEDFLRILDMNGDTWLFQPADHFIDFTDHSKRIAS